MGIMWTGAVTCTSKSGIKRLSQSQKTDRAATMVHNQVAELKGRLAALEEERSRALLEWSLATDDDATGAWGKYESLLDESFALKKSLSKALAICQE